MGKIIECCVVEPQPATEACCDRSDQRPASWGILLHAIACAAATPNYYMRVWQTDEGLPQSGVNAIVQTREGYLWIGTHSGPARFDGVRFAVFDTKNTPAMGCGTCASG